jgi:hypothetical protein
MSAALPSRQLQSLAMDDFAYFFLRLRKARIRALVQALRQQFPDESPPQLARRLIASHAQLALLAGTTLHLPGLLPGIGYALKLLGFVGGAAVLTRMHLYLILEIALLFGQDIDDQARVQEMMAVVAATGLAAGTPVVADALGLSPFLAIPAAGLTATATTQLIGTTAIEYYAALPAATAEAVTGG